MMIFPVFIRIEFLWVECAPPADVAEFLQANWFSDKMHILLCFTDCYRKNATSVLAQRNGEAHREYVVFENYAKWNGDATEAAAAAAATAAVIATANTQITFSVSNIFQYIIVMELELTTVGN